jgi:fatty acid desaturase
MATARAPKAAQSKRSDLISLALVTANVVLVLAPVYLAAALDPSPWLLLLWLWFGTTQQGLLNLMHECAHLHVFKPRWGSEVLASWLLGPLMFSDFDRYRQVHWAHHNHLGGPQDPKYSYKLSIVGADLLGFVLRSLFLAEAFRKLLYVLGRQGSSVAVSSGPKTEKGGKGWLLKTALVQLVFLGSLALVALRATHGDLFASALHLAVAYGFTYMYGILSLTVMMANLRAIAEHQPRGEDNLVGAAALRNLKSNWLSHLVFGSYGFAEHATHHRDPKLPYYLLDAETARRSDDDPGLAKTHGYLASLKAAFAGAPLTSSPAATPKGGDESPHKVRASV